MTYRERRERRADRLRGWADGRDAKSAASFAAAHTIADGIPFGQPILVGHHSERRARRDQDRIHNGIRAGIDHADKAASMRSRADNIDAAAERAIYSDDADAAERLAERIAELEAERDRITRYNASARKAHRADPGARVGDLAILTDRQRADLLSLARIGFARPDGSFPAYATANLSGNISKQRARLADMERRAAPVLRTFVAGPEAPYGAGPVCLACGGIEAGHDRRYDLAGAPLLCLA